jgi:general secretion pathway protein F
MPVFEYTALDKLGKKARGVVDADGPAAARQRLRSEGVFPVSLNPVEDAVESASAASFLDRFKRVRPVEVAMMTRQLATLTGAGLPLVSAIESLIPQTASYTFKTRLTRIKDAVVEGNSFAGALSLYPDIFSPVYTSMVQAGETSGTLEIVLERLADIAEKQQELKNRLRAALAYPVFMAMMGVLVLFFLLTYIVPGITRIFAEMNQTLPAPTRALIFISDICQNYWWAGALALGIALVIGRSLARTEQGRRFIDAWLLRCPGVGDMNRRLVTARVARTLGSLLENGVTLLSALGIVKNIADNAIFYQAIENASEKVGQGQDLAISLVPAEIFPPLAIQMIQVGEQSGELEPMLTKVADVYEQEVSSRIMALTAMLEPVMILIMGAMVGFIVLSICLPILEMNQLVK